MKLLGGIGTRVSRNRQIYRSVFALLSGNIGSSALAALGGLLVARFLGPEVTGSFRAFTIPMTYLIFLHLGTWDGLWRQIPYYHGKGMPEEVNKITSAAGAFNLLLSLTVSTGFAMLAGYSFFNHDMHGSFGWLTQVFYCWAIYYGGYLTSTYRSLNHFVVLARIQFGQALVQFGMVFLLPILGFYGLCMRVAVPGVLAVWLYHRKRPLKVNYRLDWPTIRSLLKLGLPYSIWGNIYTSAWAATESALVLLLDGSVALGLYSVALVIAGGVNALPMAIWQVLTPRVVKNFARDGSVRGANSRILFVTIALTGFMILVALVGSFAIEIFVSSFIPKYIEGIPVMKVLLWLPVIQAAFLPLTALFAVGRPWLYGRSVIAGIVVFPIATYLLLPVVGGTLAVAIGSLLGRVARTAAAYVDLMVLARTERRGGRCGATG